MVKEPHNWKRMDESYNPIIHVDVYGTIGELYNYNIEKLKYLMKLEKVVSPFKFRVESPIDAPSKEETIKVKWFKNRTRKTRSKVEIIADEWCNTLEDIKESQNIKPATSYKSRHLT